MKYLMQEMTAKNKGITTYLAGMCAIGPYCTPDPKKAILFESKQEAYNHPAYMHLLSFYEPVEANHLIE